MRERSEELGHTLNSSFWSNPIAQILVMMLKRGLGRFREFPRWVHETLEVY